MSGAYKLVNGERVEMTDDELAEFLDARPDDGVPPIPPIVVSKAQAKLALLEAKLLDGVEAALSAMEGDEGQRARIEWNDRTEFHRDHEFIALLAAAIGLTDDRVDALFARAAQL